MHSSSVVFQKKAVEVAALDPQGGDDLAIPLAAMAGSGLLKSGIVAERQRAGLPLYLPQQDPRIKFCSSKSICFANAGHPT